MNFLQNPLKNNLHTLIRLTRADIEKRFAKAEINITPLQYGVLAKLKEKPATINEMARYFSFKAPSLVPAVDALEKKQLLQRKNDPKDRRKIQLFISQKGLAKLKRLPADDKNDALNLAFNKLNQAKQKQLLTILQELIANFEQ